MKKAARRKFDPYLSLITIAIHLRMLTPLSDPKAFQKNAQPATAGTQAAWPCDSAPARSTTKTNCLQTKQAYYDNLKGKALPELQLGQIVKMKKLNENIWTEAVCKKLIGPRSYAVVPGNRSSHMLRMVVRSSLGVHHPLRILKDPDLFQTIRVQQLFLLIWHPVLPSQGVAVR